jgi:transposase
MCGVDLTRIDGIDVTTALVVVSEIGTDMGRSPTDKHFASWLGLCPGTKITGGQGDERQDQTLCEPGVPSAATTSFFQIFLLQ